MEIISSPNEIHQLEEGIFSTPGTRILDSLTVPAECSYSYPVNRFEVREFVQFLHFLCKKRGMFLAFKHSFLLRKLLETGKHTAEIQRRNCIIEQSNGRIRGFLAKLSLMQPNQPLKSLPPGGLLGVLELGCEGGHWYLQTAIHDLLQAGFLRLTTLQEAPRLKIILEPTKKMFFPVFPAK